MKVFKTLPIEVISKLNFSSAGCFLLDFNFPSKLTSFTLPENWRKIELRDLSMTINLKAYGHDKLK